ncbi:hypothetical protein HZC32_01050 [Candidatus Woesearchaeota archaeon]|nr:hypothetical protein [Candidatus Woesearchaeota archaeon]MBI5451914.1 hypothetical protein [Candidatus Gottesmanbacteria bacterium]
MDDNAQVSAVPTPVLSTPTASDDASVTANQQAAFVTPQTPTPQAATRPVEKPDKKQQISVGGHPEQGSITIDNEEDDEDEEIIVAKQEAPKLMQNSHPEIVLPPEVKDAGVKEGEDDLSKLPEERQKLEEVATEEPAPFVAVPTPSTPLPIPYLQAVEEKKITGSPKNSRSWWITEVLREWKKKFQKGEEVDVT